MNESLGMICNFWGKELKDVSGSRDEFLHKYYAGKFIDMVDDPECVYMFEQFVVEKLLKSEKKKGTHLYPKKTDNIFYCDKIPFPSACVSSHYGTYYGRA